MSEKTYENYPCWTVLVSNAVTYAIYITGAIIIYKIGLIWFGLYLLCVLFLEINVMRKSCVNCYYYGKTCAFGKGKISSMFFKKGDPQKFANRSIGWKNLLPDILVSFIPLVTGIILLIINFDWLILILILILFILITAGNGLVRGSLACKFCKQKELGCPAEQLFNKNKK